MDGVDAAVTPPWTHGHGIIIVFFIIILLFITSSSLFAISTDVNSGDVDDTVAITYVVITGFFVSGWLSYARAVVRWFVPFLRPYTILIALESAGDIKLLIQQLRNQSYGPVKCVREGFLTANYELIEVYQSGYKVALAQSNYELMPVENPLKVDLLEIAGPTSCVFNTSRRLMYVGGLLLKGQRVDRMTGANAREQSRQCVEKALQNGARVDELSPQFSRSILCCLGHNSPLLTAAVQLQCNPWAFSFLQQGRDARQFAESNQQIGGLLLAKMGLTYDSVWEKLGDRVRVQITHLTGKFPDDWDSSVVRNRILWAVFNFGGEFPWRSVHCTSVKPPFIDLCTILRLEKKEITPLELFEFRVKRVSSFTCLTEREVAEVLSHSVLYDLYAVVLLKYGLSVEAVARDPHLLTWFTDHVQTFVNSL